jgi:hypothetical protein
MLKPLYLRMLMQCIRPWLRAVLLAVVGVALSGCAPQMIVCAPVATTNLDGRAIDPLGALDDRRATVLLFITNDCPISNGFAPEIHRLCKAYMPQGIAFYLVYVDPDLTAVDARQHYRDYGYRCEALLDRRNVLARRAGATVTPEAAVFLPDGRQVYRGRINDLYVDYGKARFAPTTNDLRDMLELIVRGEKVEMQTTVAVGCHIPM